MTNPSTQRAGDNATSSGSPARNDAPLASMTVPSPLSVGIRAAAKMIGVSDRHLHGLAITGDVPSVKIGHRRLFVVDDLKAWLAQKSKGGQAL